jgi:uncharacterized protein (TIGR00725 family)
MKIKQIWIMWSAADLWYLEEVSNIAFELWKEVAKNNYILVYGAEKDSDSLSATAWRWAKLEGWLVTWITYWNTPDIWWDMSNYTDVIINTWMQRWWWREFVLVSSCDAIVVVWGGSWTLNEITIAYQKKIPVVVIEWTWGWADKLNGKYLDDRAKTDPDRFICKWVKTPKEALDYLNNL